MEEPQVDEHVHHVLNIARETEVLHSFLRVNLEDAEAAEEKPRRRKSAPQEKPPVTDDEDRRTPEEDKSPGKTSFSQLTRELKLHAKASRKGRRRGRSQRREEEVYTDKDRAAAVAMGSHDIKQSLKIKRRQDRSKALQLPEEAEPSTLLALGSREMRSGDVAIAINFVHKALELNPNDKNALVARSRCYLLLGEPQLALQDAETALKGDKNFIRGISGEATDVIMCFKRSNTEWKGSYDFPFQSKEDGIILITVLFPVEKAEALYHMGDFEHSLVFYHRGLRLRPELQVFRLGVQKAQEAIENIIGNKPMCSFTAECIKSASVSQHSSGKNSSNSSRKRVHQQSKRLLGELCVDKEYLEQLLRHPDIKCRSQQDENQNQIASFAKEGVEFLNKREEFWRQQHATSKR